MRDVDFYKILIKNMYRYRNNNRFAFFNFKHVGIRYVLEWNFSVKLLKLTTFGHLGRFGDARLRPVKLKKIATLRDFTKKSTLRSVST